MFEIRDPIHRTIQFSEREKQVIDHPFVQRLRYVRQLGLSYLVYPGATHDRFSHALGAMHLAGRMWTRICETSGDVLKKHFSDDDLAYFHHMLRFAGLLHDLGHPPFSHALEKFMPHFSVLHLPKKWFGENVIDRQATHEDYSVLLIAALARGDDAPFSEDEAQDIASCIHHNVIPSPSWHTKFGEQKGSRGGIHELLQSLISGELDCDRMDYLLRDAYFTGVAYGTHDVDHLISNLGAVSQNNIIARTIDSTAVRAFEDFLLARYHMFLQVYLHKTTIAFDHYLDQALYSGELVLTIPGDPEGYAELRDSTMMERLFEAAKNPENMWSKRLVNRRPPRLIFTSSNAKPEEKKLMDLVTARLENAHVPFFERTSHQYLSKRQETKNISSAMLVRRKMLGKFVYEPIEHYSSLLNKYNEVIDMTNLYVLPEHYAQAMEAVEKNLTTDTALLH